MLKIIKQLFALLTQKQRKRFFVLQILVVLSAFVEIIGVISIIPFMALVGDMNQLKQDTIFAQLYQMSGISSELYFVFLLGLAVLLMLFISALISMFTTWKACMFGCEIGSEISSRLYLHYLKQQWLFHTLNSTANLTKLLHTETSRVSGGILMPLMQMNARVLFSILLSFSIFIYDPKVGVVGFFIFAMAYLVLYKFVRVRLQRNGKILSQESGVRFRLINEGFGGIKDILLLGREHHFVNHYKFTNQKLAYSLGTNQALSLVPRYFIELIAFSSLITLTLYLLMSHNGNLGIILPIISVYVLATFRLLPAFQQIYVCLAAIKSNMASFESIKQDLFKSSRLEITSNKSDQTSLNLMEKISLEDVSFTYPGKVTPTLNQINISILANSVVGIVGESGSGKSTLINILLGLIEPQEGLLKIDSTPINDKNRRSWQNTIGFVAQSIFLSEGTISENVAFGIPPDQINLEQVQTALKLAHLSELIKSLEHGIHTKVGERGVQLSGGQRQRIGIARALYHEAKVLVFDEATSSLDGITEKMIIEDIHEFSGQKTIIMVAHRLKTVKKCDLIFFMDKGKLIDKGTFQELVDRNEHFKNLTTHA